jgi:hypothetical protein
MPQEQKKGTNPWVWVAVGCAAVVLLSAVVLFVAGIFVFNKAREVAGELDENPIAAASKMIAAANPDIELVETDEENRTVTFRNTKTDEVYTIDFEDIEEGKLSFFSDEGTFSLDIESGEDDEGRLTVTTDEGTTTFGAGIDAGDLPSYVPLYPGTTPEGTYSAETTEGRSGAFTIKTEDDLEEVMDFYVSELEKRGLEIFNKTTAQEGAFLMARSSDEALTVNVAFSVESGGTQVVVNFNEK